LRLYNVVQNSTISNPSLKTVFLNAFPAVWADQFLGVNVLTFWKEGVNTQHRTKGTNVVLYNSPVCFSVVTPLVHVRMGSSSV
jgi:hypothetical protein